MFVGQDSRLVLVSRRLIAALRIGRRVQHVIPRGKGFSTLHHDGANRFESVIQTLCQRLHLRVHLALSGFWPII